MKKRNTIKRILSLALVMLLILPCLAGCSTGGQSSGMNSPFNLPTPTTPNAPAGNQPGSSNEPSADIPENTTPVASDQLIVEEGETISYVMIYNPAIYTGDKNTQSRQTGDIAKQISVDMDRGDDLATEPESVPYTQGMLNPDILDQLNLEGGKADGLGKFYHVGDKENFYCGSERNVNQRVNQQFTCVYAGSHANIWVYDQFDQATLNRLGKAFDDNIYSRCVELFGQARFGEIVNVLLYPFSGDQNTVGFFYGLDLFSTMECDDATARSYGVNRDINVININSLWLKDEDTLISTLAHEFQHLLCFTGYFTAENECDVWFNEAMSAYIEEDLFPGSKQDSVDSFLESDRIRYGQSLYNFGIDTSMFQFDIGVYGSVYLFSEYLRNIAGDDVFSNFHKNWRNTYTATTTLQGIYNAVPGSARQEIDQLVNYPDTYRFDSPESEWMSKLTLSFYLSTFTADSNAASRYRNIDLNDLMYDTMMKAEIEGGGRVILATKDGSFEIPENADSGLVYVGLNEDMEIVTNIACS